MAIPPRYQRHQYLRSEGLGYTDADIINFKERLGRIYGKEIHRVQVFNFGGLTYLMVEGLSGRMLMEHRDAQGHRDFLGTAPSYTWITDLMLRLCHMLIACNIAGRSQAPKKVTMADLFYLRGVDVGSFNIPYLLARYLRLFTSGRKHGVMISGGARRYLGLVALGPERRQVAAAGALEVAEGAPDVDESDHAVSVLVQAPQPPASGHISPEKKSMKLVKYQPSGILLIIEYLVKISKKARILELKQRHLKILTLISYTPKGYQSQKEQKPTRNEETSTRERFEANIESRIKTVVEKSQESKEKDKVK
ncbi:hypothetical protein Tco_0876842 [Tanacetum coccineum]|uniref:Uncharacterized protein n=1 Tax=Tanacetum coccineum TaxID=301880 RepID=A0ABQ5BW52_9ASTR